MRLEHRISLAGELFRQARRPRREHAPAKDGRRRMLVIRLDRIGDFALYLPFAAALRRAFPPESCHITLLGNTLWMPLARRMLDFDRFIELDPQRFLSDAVLRRTLLDEVAAMRCDLLLQPRFHRELLLEDLIAMAAAAPESLAFSGTTRHIRKRRLLRPWNRPYGRLLDAAPLHDTHELVKNRCFLDSAAPGGEPVPNPWRKRPPLPAALAALAGCTVSLPGGGWFRRACCTGLPSGAAGRCRRNESGTQNRRKSENLLVFSAKAGYIIPTVWRGVSGIGLILWNSVVISIRAAFRGLIPGFRESKGPAPDGPEYAFPL